MADLQTFQEHVKKGDLDAVRTALAADPSLLDATNDSGQSAFLLAKYYRQEPIAQYLLSLEPKLDLFSLCVAGQSSPVIEEIAQNPALLESHSPDGWTPLHLVSFFGWASLAKELIERGAQVDSRSTNPMKNTPLHAAAAGGHADIVRLLIDHGADPNAVQEGGWTALHSAAQAGNRAMVEALLANGAQLNPRAANNQSPLDLALLQGHQEIATLLEELGATLQKRSYPPILK